jgi:hypothetical protein
MHNELIRGESVEPILLGDRLLGELCAIDLIGRLWLDQLAPVLLAIVRCLRLGCCKRDRCGRSVERLRCAPGEAGLASAARSAHRLAQLAITRARTTLKRPRCGLGLSRWLGRWRWRGLGCGRGVSRRAARAGRGDVKRDHAVARERATGHWLLGDDEPQERGVTAKGPLKARAKPGPAHGLCGVTGTLAGVLAHCLTACRSASPVAGGALDCCGLVAHRGY